MRSVSLHGERGSVNGAEIAHEVAKLREALCDYEPCKTCSVDETGLFFKLLPRRTYVTTHENKSSLRGTKVMMAKDRITAYMCINADGSCKLPMAIIGKPKKRQCFRMGRSLVPYFSQKNAWYDSVTFKLWFDEVFLPHVPKWTSKRVALVMDNYGPHGTDSIDSREQVTITTLPPNCTGRHQPMDLGIIGAWKVPYRRNMLCLIVADLEDRMQLREKSANKPAGTKSMAEGYDPHMLDVAELVMQSWKCVSQINK